MRLRHIVVAASLIAIALAPVAVGWSADESARPDAGKPAAANADAAADRGMPDLPKALKAQPGCLGVEVARTMSGKQVIFAWFKDKSAVQDWYYSDAHQDVMQRFAPDYDVNAGPLENVPDDAGPILVIAALTPAAKSSFKEMKIPVAQISIELYAPLPGGAALGGRFAPAGVKVPHMREIAVPAEGQGAAGERETKRSE
jgi:hypothetical protein